MENTLYSLNGQYPQTLPDRLRLSNGLTLTDRNSFTEEILSAEGYAKAPLPPIINTNFHKLEWTGSSWVTLPLSEEELNFKKLQRWNEIYRQREELFKLHEWRISRHQSELRLGLTPSEDITIWDQYFQSLRDITKQEDPFNIIWPVQP